MNHPRNQDAVGPANAAGPPRLGPERQTRRRTMVGAAADQISHVLAAVRRLRPHREVLCEHLHETTTRYDHAAKRLDFLLACPVCKTEKVIHSLEYEPRFEPTGATVRVLASSDAVQPTSRAA